VKLCCLYAFVQAVDSLSDVQTHQQTASDASRQSIQRSCREPKNHAAIWPACHQHF